MATGTITTTCTVSGLPSGSKTIAPAGVALTAAVGQIEDKTLSTGDNTITVPSGTTYVVIAFPVTTATVTWKGLSGDTGTQMFAGTTVAVFVTMLVSGLASFVLTVVSGPITGVEFNFL